MRPSLFDVIMLFHLKHLLSLWNLSVLDFLLFVNLFALPYGFFIFLDDFVESPWPLCFWQGVVSAYRKKEVIECVEMYGGESAK